jgi:sugar phosphate isomerase/epimerase
VAKGHGLEITELSTHLQGQLVAVHPAYDEAFDAFAPPAVHGKPKERQKWAVEQVMAGAKASRNLGLDASVTFSGALAWPFVYPWPQRPAGMIDMAFEELAKRWTPILDAYDEHGVDVCYEIHPGEDLMDGATFEMFLAQVKNHKRCCINYDPSHFVLQHLDYLAFIDIYHERIKAFHPMAARASIRASSPGSTAPAVSARWATARSISARYSPSSRPMIMIHGRCSNGNAA